MNYMNLSKMALTHKLSLNYRVSSCIKLIKQENKSELADFVHERFTSRYIDPFDNTPKELKSGFAIMASCCLMIEALESFYRGIDDTKRISRDAFKTFINRRDELEEFRPYVDGFYINVRCGILHQGETKGGWVINRTGDLLDESKPAINATIFLRRMRMAVEAYRDELKAADWDSDVWKKCRKKIDHIIENCEKS